MNGLLNSELGPSRNSLPKILAVIPTFNAAAYVESAVRSVLNQQYPNLRTIVVDDFSSYDVRGLLAIYEKKIEIIVNQKNMGFSGSLNHALSLLRNEEYLLIVQDDVRLSNPFFIINALKNFAQGVAVVCGQPDASSKDSLSLLKRIFARYNLLDVSAQGIQEISYSILKADLIRVSAIKEVGGFSFSESRGLGLEDQIFANSLHEHGYVLLQDGSLKYRADYARTESLLSFFKKESLYGSTIGFAIVSRMISLHSRDKLGRKKRNHRLQQIAFTFFLFLFLAMSLTLWPILYAVIPVLLLIELTAYASWAPEFEAKERLSFVVFALISDFIFTFSFAKGAFHYWLSRLHKRRRKQPFLCSNRSSAL